MIKYSCWTHTGLIRKNNEDYCEVVTLPGEIRLFMVADGIGGNAGGEVASKLAITTIINVFSSTEVSSISECRNRISGVVRQAHQAVMTRSELEPELAGMGTTLTMVAVKGSQGLVAHVGDSRAYHIRGEDSTQITMDHSLSQEWVRDGKITPEEAMFHPYRNMLTRALGVDPFSEPELIDIDLKARDRLLLCTDGLSNMVDETRLREIAAAYKDMDELVTVLGQEALGMGGHDNITMIGIQVENKEG